VFAAGLLLGTRVPAEREGATASDVAAAAEIKKLREELETVSKTVAWSLLQQQPAGERLEKVRSLEAAPARDSAVNQLLSVLAYDSSPTVRRSAVESLSRYSAEPVVPRALATALPREESPVVQLAMIDLLAASRDPIAADALATFARSETSNATVRAAASYALTRL
jgi:hypothetical protein